MKNFNYYFFTLFLVCTICQQGVAQDYELRSRTKATGLVAVDVRFVGAGQEPQAGVNFLVDFTVELRYPVSAGLDYVSIDNSAGYNMRIGSPETVDGTDEYIGFGLVDFLPFPETWTRNEWFEIFAVQFNGDGSSDEIVAVGELGSSPLQPMGIPNVGVDGSDFPPAVVGPAASLPVELARFDVAKFKATSARLEWATASEENTSHFDVERSTDANHWTKIATVDATGNSEQILSYEAYDLDIDPAVRGAGAVFYRLHMIDFDGHADYSPIRTVEFGTGSVALSVYPNPTVDLVNVEAEEEIVSITVFDEAGRQLTVSNTNQIDLGVFPVGNYRLSIETATGVAVRTVVKGR